MAKRIVDRRKPPAVQKVISAATALAARRDYASWYSTLSEIRLASETHGLGLHERDPCMAVQTVLGKVSLVQLGGPYVTFTANLGMSDATMFDTFRDWLKVARDHVKQPRTGRGKSPSTRLGETQFAQ